jgi:cell division protein FtsI (penicillin-binding protein 3)
MANQVGDILTRVPTRLTIDGTAKKLLETARHRLLITGALFGLAFVVAALRLVDVAILKQAREPRSARIADPQRLAMSRADIVDRNGVQLATSLASPSLYANPKQIANATDVAAKIAGALALPGLDEKDLRQRLVSERRFVLLRRNLTPRQQDAVHRLGIPGVYFQREERRVYPNGALAAHVVGFTDIDGDGWMGIEQAFDEKLRNHHEPVTLSLDIRAQHAVREEVERAMNQFRAVGGAALVMDANSAEIIAMVSLPDFDPNAAGASPEEARFNRLTLGTYEPGSTFKTFTAAMALEYRTANLNSSFDARRPITISSFTIDDYKPQRRVMTLPEVFMLSSNIGSVRIAETVGRERQRDFLARLHLLNAPKFEMLELTAPQIPKPWREISMMTVAFGHGISISPLQLVASTAAIVNGGIYRDPTMIKRDDTWRDAGERVLSAKTSEQMRQLMRLVVERGTAKSADVPGYLVGGKTGTAEKIVGGRYKKDARISSFVGAFPMNTPRFVVYMMLDEPKGNQATHGYATAGWVIAPSIQRIVQRIAALYGVEPVASEIAAAAMPTINVASR